MTRRECLMVMTLLTVALVSAKGSQTGILKDASQDEQVRASEVENKNRAEANPVDSLAAERTPLIPGDKSLASAYFTTLSILSTINGCSLFFGGPAASIDVFKQLIGKVQKKYFSAPVGIQMSGEPVNIRNASTTREYRMFGKVAINTNGPFYQRIFSPTGRLLPFIGSFGPNTSEVRVLMLLHELGHLMKGEDGNWLLPNDGKDESLSRVNSQKIEAVCGKQIRALQKEEGKSEAQTTLAGQSAREPDTVTSAELKSTANTADELKTNQ